MRSWLLVYGHCCNDLCTFILVSGGLVSHNTLWVYLWLTNQNFVVFREPINCQWIIVATVGGRYSWLPLKYEFALWLPVGRKVCAFSIFSEVHQHQEWDLVQVPLSEVHQHQDWDLVQVPHFFLKCVNMECAFIIGTFSTKHVLRPHINIPSLNA